MTDEVALLQERPDQLLATVDPASARPEELRGGQYELGPGAEVRPVGD